MTTTKRTSGAGTVIALILIAAGMSACSGNDAGLPLAPQTVERTLSTGATAPVKTTVEGRVAKLDLKHRALKIEGKSVTVLVPVEATIKLAGQVTSLSLDDLVVGDLIVVIGVQNPDGTVTAERIVVQRMLKGVLVL